MQPSCQPMEIRFKDTCSSWSQYTFQAHLQDMTVTCRQQSFATSTSNPTGVSRQISPPDQNLFNCSIGLFCTGYFLIRYKFVPIQMNKSPWIECQIYDITSARGQRRNFHSDVIPCSLFFQVGLQREQKCNSRTVTTFF